MEDGRNGTQAMMICFSECERDFFDRNLDDGFFFGMMAAHEGGFVKNVK